MIELQGVIKPVASPEILEGGNYKAILDKNMLEAKTVSKPRWG